LAGIAVGAEKVGTKALISLKCGEIALMLLSTNRKLESYLYTLSFDAKINDLG